MWEHSEFLDLVKSLDLDPFIDPDGSIDLDEVTPLMQTETQMQQIQAMNKLLTASKYRVSDTKVCILYIDNETESTAVSKLRIGPDGEFLDRWPHGFFTERTKELF